MTRTSPLTIKNVFVLRVDNYRPDLCRYTIPTIKYWAARIGAVYREITDRVYPDWPVTYEKMQVYELGVGAIWNILVDADFMLHPDLPDFTKTLLEPPVVGIHYGFKASTFFKDDVYFARVGHDQGIAGGFVITSYLTHDLWEPLDMSCRLALTRTKRAFIVDEYCLSRNLAKYGLKYSGIEYTPEIAKQMIHIGSEERSDEERKADVEKARCLYLEWFKAAPI